MPPKFTLGSRSWAPNTKNYQKLFGRAEFFAEDFAEGSKEFVNREKFDAIWRDPQPVPLIDLQTPEDLQSLVLASDSDIGGSSRIDIGLSSDLNEPDHLKSFGRGATGAFAVASGRISLAMRREVAHKLRGGYVGFRTKEEDAAFGRRVTDIRRHTHLSVMVRPGGDPKFWPHWFINVQTDGYFSDDLWTHRLDITGSGKLGGGWEECLIPLKALVQLHLGAIADKQLPPDLMRLKTLGLSLLGAPRTDPNRWTQAEARRSTRPPEGIEGVFELAIGRISAVYKHPHFTDFRPPYYQAPPSKLHFDEGSREQIRAPEYPSFEEAHYKPTDRPTFERGKYPAYEVPMGTLGSGARVADRLGDLPTRTVRKKLDVPGGIEPGRIGAARDTGVPARRPRIQGISAEETAEALGKSDET